VPKVSDAHRQAMRERIHAAAVSAVREKGLQGASMADIIAESGLSAGAIYSYYRSKDELVMAVARSVVGGRFEVLAALSQEDPVPSPAAALRRLLGGLNAAGVDVAIAVQIWAAAATDPAMGELSTEVLNRMRMGVEGYLTRWFIGGGRSPQDASARAAALAPAMVGLAQGYIVQEAVLPDFDPEAYLAAVDIALARA